MKRIALLGLCALAASPAAAQTRACRDMRALLNADGGNFRSVAWTLEAGIGTFATVNGRRVALPAAEGCELDADSQQTQVHCRWHFGDATAAGAGYDDLVRRVNACLARPLRARTLTPTDRPTRMVRQDERDFATGNRQTEVGLALFEHLDQDGLESLSRPPRLYAIELKVSIDTARVLSREDVADIEEDDD